MNSLDENITEISDSQKEELHKLRENFNSLMKDIMDDSLPINLHDIFPKTGNLEKLKEQLLELKKCLDSFRPFNYAQLNNLQEAFDTEYTYESNRIEGNTLTLSETALVVSQGITISGKPLKDHFEAVNHRDAINYIRKIAESNIDFSEKVLLEIHALILRSIDIENAGFYRRDRVRIQGSRHICPNPLKIPGLMKEYFEFYEKNKDLMHPVELAANMHEKLVTIHPFIDGNGRTARLVMNLILLRNGYPITVINSERNKREEYYKTLEESQISSNNDNLKFILLIGEYTKQWCFKYFEMIAPSVREDAKDKGYYFFKKIEPYMKK